MPVARKRRKKSQLTARVEPEIEEQVDGIVDRIGQSDIGRYRAADISRSDVLRVIIAIGVQLEAAAPDAFAEVVCGYRPAPVVIDSMMGALPWGEPRLVVEFLRRGEDEARERSMGLTGKDAE